MSTKVRGSPSRAALALTPSLPPFSFCLTKIAEANQFLSKEGVPQGMDGAIDGAIDTGINDVEKKFF